MSDTKPVIARFEGKRLNVTSAEYNRIYSVPKEHRGPQAMSNILGIPPERFLFGDFNLRVVCPVLVIVDRDTTTEEKAVALLAQFSTVAALVEVEAECFKVERTPATKELLADMHKELQLLRREARELFPCLADSCEDIVGPW